MPSATTRPHRVIAHFAVGGGSDTASACHDWKRKKLDYSQSDRIADVLVMTLRSRIRSLQRASRQASRKQRLRLDSNSTFHDGRHSCRSSSVDRKDDPQCSRPENSTVEKECVERTDECRVTLASCHQVPSQQQQESRAVHPTHDGDNIEVRMERLSENEFFVDLTDASKLAALAWVVAPEESKWDPQQLCHFCTLCQAQVCSCRTPELGHSYAMDSTSSVTWKPDQQMDSTRKCRLHGLAARGRNWWDRPIWAWTPHELILAHGAMLALELRQTVLSVLVGRQEAGPTLSLSTSVSSSKLLARMPSQHLLHDASSKQGRGYMMLIEPHADHSVVRALLDPMPLESLNGRMAGKFGFEAMAAVGSSTVAELAMLPVCAITGLLLSSASKNDDMSHERHVQCMRDAEYLHSLARGKCVQEIQTNSCKMKALNHRIIGCGKQLLACCRSCSATDQAHLDGSSGKFWDMVVSCSIKLSEQLTEQLRFWQHLTSTVPTVLTVSMHFARRRGRKGRICSCSEAAPSSFSEYPRLAEVLTRKVKFDPSHDFLLGSSHGCDVVFGLLVSVTGFECVKEGSFMARSLPKESTLNNDPCLIRVESSNTDAACTGSEPPPSGNDTNPPKRDYMDAHEKERPQQPPTAASEKQTFKKRKVLESKGSGMAMVDQDSNQGPHDLSSPQIDSHGIDLTVLSQLPASIRSEVRMAAVVKEPITASKRVTKSAHTDPSHLKRWLSGAGRGASRMQHAKKSKGITARQIIAPEANRISEKAGDDGEHGSLFRDLSHKDRRSRILDFFGSQQPGQIQAATFLSARDVDLDVLEELPEDIRSILKSEIDQELVSERKRKGITAFFAAK